MTDSTVLVSGNFLIPDGTFFAEIVAFVLILVFMRIFAVPKLQASMQRRQDLIRQQIEDSREAKERLDASEAAYKTAIAEAHAEAARLRDEANRTRSEIIEAAKEEARIAAEAVTRRAEERRDIEHRQVLVELRREMGQIAVDLAGKIVGESLADEALQRRIIDRFLAELDSQEKQTASEQTAPDQPQQVS